MSNGKGPKVKPRGGETKLKESKAKAFLFKRKESGRKDPQDLIRSLNAINGVSIASSVGTGALKSMGKKINKVIPFTGKND